MRYSLKIFTGFSISLALIFLVPSCNKFVEVPQAKNTVGDDAVFGDSADAESSIVAMYIDIMNTVGINHALGGYITLYTGLASDEIYSTTGDPTELKFYENALTAANAYNGFWADLYKLIYHANACIEGLNKSSIAAPTKNQFLGEAEFMRALSFFELANLYGGVPLTVTTDYKVNASLPRTSKDSVYSQIITDLKDASQKLSTTYFSQGRVRPNQYTALALLARVYLYLGKWQEAEATANTIIGSGTYSLETDLNSVFLLTSNEAIWQLQPVRDNFETPEGFSFVSSDPTIVPSYVISDFLLNSFEPGDMRRSAWLDSSVVNGTAYYYPYKYKIGYDGNMGSPTEGYTLFRLAEQYLIRAEARAQQNSNLSGAIDDINVIRQRSSLDPFPDTLSQPQALDAIAKERRVELFLEIGQRWFDLKRTGQADAVMSIVTPQKGGSWSSNWQLFPIPLDQIQANPFLKQNQGY